ncbi:MAG: type II secretion system protein GspN [Deltaproteobacteria bacterium]|nr:type II secretion system protein GspN [Deltaproteobacteria bacterium]
MTERAKKIWKYVGYGAFFFFATLLFVYSTFPLEAVQGRINKAIQAQAPNLSVAFDRATPYRLSGLEVDDLAVTIQPSAAQPGETPTTVRVDHVKARLNILPLLKKSYEVSYDVTLGDSNVSGVAKTGAESNGIVLDMQELDLGKLPAAVYKLIGTRTMGIGNGKVDVSLDNNDPKKSNGKGTIELKRTGVAEITLKNVHPMMPGDLSLPAVDLGAINIGFEIKEGTLQIKQFQQKGADLELRITGDIALKKQLMLSQLNLTIEYKVNESFVQKNPKLAILSAGRKNAEGFGTVKLQGTLQAPQPQM